MSETTIRIYRNGKQPREVVVQAMAPDTGRFVQAFARELAPVLAAAGDAVLQDGYLTGLLAPCYTLAAYFDGYPVAGVTVRQTGAGLLLEAGQMAPDATVVWLNPSPAIMGDPANIPTGQDVAPRGGQ